MLSLLQFVTGLLIFLLGLYVLKIGLAALGGFNFKKIINNFTKTHLLGCLTGTILTAFLQSSSALTVMAIGLVDTGLMSFKQAFGIILGTNIGTTFTGQIMAFNLEKWGIPLFFLGLVLIVLFKKRIRYLGLNLTGMGLIFTGMNYMGQAFMFFKDHPLFFTLLSLTGENKLSGILFGIIATAIIQSSSAMTGIVLVLAKNNQLDLIQATAIILGSNIGTSITAILASIGSTLNGKRIAGAHVLLNLLGVIIFYPFIEEFAKLMTIASNDLPRQIAHIHTVFNIISSLVVLPFANLFTRLVYWIVPE